MLYKWRRRGGTLSWCQPAQGPNVSLINENNRFHIRKNKSSNARPTNTQVLTTRDRNSTAVRENLSWGGRMLLPYANRIAGGRYFFNGSQHQVTLCSALLPPQTNTFVGFTFIFCHFACPTSCLSTMWLALITRYMGSCGTKRWKFRINTAAQKAPSLCSGLSII